jgi:hypothetical protein
MSGRQNEKLSSRTAELTKPPGRRQIRASSTVFTGRICATRSIILRFCSAFFRS